MGKKVLYTIIGIVSLVLILFSLIIFSFDTQIDGDVVAFAILTNSLITAIPSFIIMGLLVVSLILVILRVVNNDLKPVSVIYTLVSFLLVLLSIIYLIGLIGETNFENYINPIYYVNGINKNLNIGLISVGMILLIINIIISINLSNEVKTNIYKKQEQVSYQNSTSLPEIDPEFTSSPNEQTFNIADKLAKLKDNLNNGVFETDLEEINLELDNNENLEKNTENNVEDVKQVIEEIEQPVVDNLKNQNIAPTNKLPKESELEPILEPKDPYKQTIVPRRSAGKAREYKKPIGNVVLNLSNQNSQRRSAKYDANYEGKVFLGDSDRIWEAMKKQERNFVKKANIKESLDNNFINKIIEEKEKTIELNNFIDPINESNESLVDNPTIDWDD